MIFNKSAKVVLSYDLQIITSN